MPVSDWIGCVEIITEVDQDRCMIYLSFLGGSSLLKYFYSNIV
jgi:hypothetical protein